MVKIKVRFNIFFEIHRQVHLPMFSHTEKAKIQTGFEAKGRRNMI